MYHDGAHTDTIDAMYPSNKLRMDMANNCTLAVMKLGKDEANRDVVIWYFLCFLTIETR